MRNGAKRPNRSFACSSMIGREGSEILKSGCGALKQKKEGLSPTLKKSLQCGEERSARR